VFEIELPRLFAMSGPVEWRNGQTGQLRRWPNVAAMADEMGASRVWAGAHFRSSVDAGRRVGRQVATEILDRQLLPTLNRAIGPREGRGRARKIVRLSQCDAHAAPRTNFMAGHSKWANIQHRKGRQDEKRGKIWTRLIREIVVAARHGGGELSMNPRLRLAVEKAKGANMPADTIRKNIDKATGNLEGMSYEEIRYEGYGIGGAAIIVDAMTDNRVRTVAEVRHAFSKYGGNLGQEGSVGVPVQGVRPVRARPGNERGPGDGGRARRRRRRRDHR
jgi:hypothetical protein